MFELVTDDRALTRLTDQLAERDWVGVDTEFVRERTYWPQLCLIQLSDRHGTVACVDVLALDSLDPLLDLLWRPDITKVFHAASQDLEVLYRLRGEPLTPVFDTQVAAALLGGDDQIGYAAVVEAHTGVKLEKAHTRTDWSRRPLRQVELEYAADDVRHLPALYDALYAELEERERIAWLEQECLALTFPARYSPDPGNAWKRVKGAQRLDAAGLGRLRAVAEWRELTAMRNDRPRRWILSDELLVQLAADPPTGVDTLEAIEGMPPAVVRKHGDTLVPLLAAAEPDAAEPQPAGALDRSQRDQVTALLKEVRRIASELGITPAMLATRKDIEAVIRGEIPTALTEGWRAPLLATVLPPPED